ncbi:amino acid-binding protein [uncultured Adlercreutzia sp.]|uniref:amino acid-binding protein n=1 Tax=uncultured Adlercreutzia sp. TaxID=875803 RepID=UPI0025D2CA6C|nr:amino acid-binding protein [uncultured Adlercreutzia sp.]
MISQLTVFLANEKGRLAAICRTLADADINMKALFIADTADFGIVRIFCDTPRRATEVLTEAGFRATVTPVIAVSVADEPGTLARLVGFCEDASMNIEYGYCFSVSGQTAIDVLKIEEEGAEAVLAEAGFKVLAPEEVYEVDPS